MYDVIVLGATFAAAGIARRKENCLVLERRAQAGCEFIGTLDFSANEHDLYTRLQRCRTLFCTEVVSVEKHDDGFTCVTHGVDGYRTYRGKQVIDTRCTAEMSLSKTYNLLICSKERPTFPCKPVGEDRYVVYCPVAPDAGFAEARAEAWKIISQFSHTQRLILSANEFDYRVKEGYPQLRDGILYLPSKAYASGSLAMAAGEEAVK